MKIVELLDIVYECSLTKKSRVDFMLELIDNMLISDAENPFEESEDDTLSRIFLGSNSFPRKKAKYIYTHKSEGKLSSYIRNMGDEIVLNIETMIQNNDDSYEQDASCYKLADYIFQALYAVCELPKRTEKKRIEPTDERTDQLAREFCINHEEEIELLPLCQIAVFINPLHKYVRQMYTDFCLCTETVRKAILSTMNCKMIKFTDDDWVSKSLELFDRIIHEKKLCTVSYLYDGAKYFHRAFERYSDVSVRYNPWIFEQVVDPHQSMPKQKHLCSFNIILWDYLEMIQDDANRKLEPPLDTMWNYCRDVETPERCVTYWVCMSMIAVCSILVHMASDVSKKDAENDVAHIDIGDAESLINTEEDMYLYALLELFKLLAVYS